MPARSSSRRTHHLRQISRRRLAPTEAAAASHRYNLGRCSHDSSWSHPQPSSIHSTSRSAITTKTRMWPKPTAVKAPLQLKSTDTKPKPKYCHGRRHHTLAHPQDPLPVQVKASNNRRRWTRQCPEPPDPPSSHSLDSYPDDQRYSCIASPCHPGNAVGWR